MDITELHFGVWCFFVATNEVESVVSRENDRPELPAPLGELEELSEELRGVVQRLTEISLEALDRQRLERGAVEVTARYVRSLIRARRLRDSYFKGGLFGDPAWDMLLDLLAARLEGHRVAVSSLCIAAAVPPTTALRWISTLTNRGILHRSSDPEEPRRVYIELPDDVARALCAYLRAARAVTDQPV